MTPTRALPHETGLLHLSDGGIETSLIFDEAIDLPHFAAFPLLRDEAGRRTLTRYFEPYIAVARRFGLPFVLESPTWRASPDWAALLGFSPEDLAAANVDAIALMRELRERHETAETPILVSGCVGPRGDGYVAGASMSPDAAEAYHDHQIAAMARAGCDFVSAITMTNVPEAIGVVRAARRHGLPSVVAFTVETDGRTPAGQPLGRAIAEVDAATDAAPAYYMINCAHPSHFAHILQGAPAWSRRVAGIRANASSRSHAELNDAPDIDRGDPAALAADYRTLRDLLPHLAVVGGCCGTDHRHVHAIASALVEAP